MDMRNIKDIYGRPVSEIHLDPLMRIEEESSLKEAVELMRKKRKGYVTVFKGEMLVGILTERDILMKVVGTAVSMREKVKGIMTKNPLTIPNTTPLSEAVTQLLRHGYRNLPVVGENGIVEGVLSTGAIVKHIAEHYHTEVFNLPPNLHQTIEKPHGG